MTLFQLPPPTRYDLYFTIAQIPVRVHPLFWLMAFLFGFSLGDPAYILLWVAIVFISVLLHELGHALVMRKYGLSPSIVLYALGGGTAAEPLLWGTGRARVALHPLQEIFIVAAGPLSNFLFAGLIILGALIAGGHTIWARWFFVAPWPYIVLPSQSAFVNSAVHMLLWVNLFWAMLNLAPVYPLDGGQIARHAWSHADPYRGLYRSLWLSLVAGALISAAGLFLWRSAYLFLLFGVLAFQSYQALQAYR